MGSPQAQPILQKGRGLFPAGFGVAGLALGDVGLFPLRDRLRFVVAHLVVHAGAIFQHDLIGRAALVVGNALIDPFDVVGGGGTGASRRERTTGRDQNRICHLMTTSPLAFCAVRNDRRQRRCMGEAPATYKITKWEWVSGSRGVRCY